MPNMKKPLLLTTILLLISSFTYLCCDKGNRPNHEEKDAKQQTGKCSEDSFIAIINNAKALTDANQHEKAYTICNTIYEKTDSLTCKESCMLMAVYHSIYSNTTYDLIRNDCAKKIETLCNHSSNLDIHETRILVDLYLSIDILKSLQTSYPPKQILYTDNLFNDTISVHYFQEENI